MKFYKSSHFWEHVVQMFSPTKGDAARSGSDAGGRMVQIAIRPDKPKRGEECATRASQVSLVSHTEPSAKYPYNYRGDNNGEGYDKIYNNFMHTIDDSAPTGGSAILRGPIQGGQRGSKRADREDSSPTAQNVGGHGGDSSNGFHPLNSSSSHEPNDCSSQEFVRSNVRSVVTGTTQ